MNRPTNPKCNSCQDSRNCINGKFCMKLKKYVEGAQAPPCKCS